MPDYYGITPSSDFFMHYGVKGMKWGIRKYVSNNLAHPNGKWMSMYGPPQVALKKVSPRTMQRHFNLLDKSYANIRAKERGAAIDLNNLLYEKQFLNSKKKKSEKSKSNNKDKKIARIDKANRRVDAAINKVIQKGLTYTAQSMNIEALQDMVAGKAIDNKYSVRSKSVLRPRNVLTKRGYVTVGIGGQRVKIRKNGDGQANFIMYEKDNRGKKRSVNLTAELNARRKS